MQRTRTVLLLELVKMASIVVFVYGFGRAGVLAACAGVGVAFAANAAVAVWSLHRGDGLPVNALLAPMIGPLFACGPMVLAVMGVRALSNSGLVPWLALATEVGCGAVAYVVSAFWFAAREARELIELLRGALYRRA